MSKKLTTEEFVKKTKNIHKNKYDYSLVDYKYSKLKVTIICPKHGEFEQIPNAHLMGQGCPKCGGTHKSTTIEFIQKAKLIHDKKYDYSLVDYFGSKSKVIIICNKHGNFYKRLLTI